MNPLSGCGPAVPAASAVGSVFTHPCPTSRGHGRFVSFLFRRQSAYTADGPRAGAVCLRRLGDGSRGGNGCRPPKRDSQGFGPLSGCGQSPQISPQDGLGKEARRGGREDSLGRLPSFAAKRAGDEARLVECRVCGGMMMWKILPGEGRVPPVRRHTSPPRWKMYDGSVSRFPARRESFLMGKTPRKKLFPVNRPKPARQL